MEEQKKNPAQGLSESEQVSKNRSNIHSPQKMSSDVCSAVPVSELLEI